MRKKIRVRLFKSIIPQTLVIVAFFFLGKYLIENKSEIINALRETQPIYMMLGIVLTLLMLVLMSVGWTFSIRLTGYKLSAMKGLIVYYRSSIFRYLPGTLWYLPGRGYFCQQEGISITAFSTSAGLELFYILSTAGLLGGIGLEMHFGRGGVIVSVISLLVMMGLLLFPGILNLSFIRKYFSRIPSRREHFQMIVIYLIVWVTFGMSIVILLIALNSPIHNNDIFFIITVNTAAWLIGFLSFIPLGLGVRETTLVWMLGSIAPIEVVFMMSLLQRAIEISGEAGLWILASWIQKQQRSKEII